MVRKSNGNDRFHFSRFTFEYEQQEKDTGASTGLVQRVQRLKFQVWVNCPFSEMMRVLLLGTTARFRLKSPKS